MSRDTKEFVVAKMTALERRSSLSLACIFALRMLGLFLILPVFSIEASRYSGGSDVSLVGLAMGIFGLTQACLQLPYGLLSDYLGRKRVMIGGLLIFAAGSLIAASADSVIGLLIGRAIQGAGAISAVVTATIADQTRDEVRTKSMALVGVSAVLMFALSLFFSPILVGVIGLSGLFSLTAVLSMIGIVVVVLWVPRVALVTARGARGRLRDVLGLSNLRRLDVGAFVLHAVQLAMWLAVPQMLVDAGLSRDHHWWVYLPAVLLSFVMMSLLLFPLERKGFLRAVFLGAIGLLALVECGFYWAAENHLNVSVLMALLFLFFCSFNVLEASMPSMVSRQAPAESRGAALGAFNTMQSLGLFFGGAVGGWLIEHTGLSGLFSACALAILLWLASAWAMSPETVKANTQAEKA